MDKKRYIMPLVAVMDMRGERLMGMADPSGKGDYVPSHVIERKVTSAY